MTTIFVFWGYIDHINIYTPRTISIKNMKMKENASETHVNN